MTTYQATIRHSSIARARVIDCGSDLNKAKTLATEEFGDGFRDHVIVIMEADGPHWGAIVSSRVIGRKHWQDA